MLERDARPPQLHVEVASEKGRSRHRNEDAHLILFGGRLLAIADGLDKRPLAGTAARTAVSAVAGHFQRCRVGEGELARMAPMAAMRHLRTAFGRAHDAVRRTSREEAMKSGMATALTAVLITGGHLVVAHVGDGACFVQRDGVVKALTLHRGVDERGSSGAIGLEASADLETTVEPQKDRDVILVCSNGLCDGIEQEVLGRVLSTETPGDGIAAGLVEIARTAGLGDNTTAIVVCVQPQPGVA